MNTQYAMITGASGGIGSAIARRLAKEGYSLALWGNRSQEKLAAVAEECGPAPVLTLTGDLGNSAVVTEQIKKVYTTFPRIDLLVNCAGISHIGLLTDMTDDEWNNIVQTNLSSVFYCCRSVVPKMVHEKKGRILNISSVWGNSGASCEVAYSATKGGLNSFTKALAAELAPSGITVNALSCGIIDTPMNHCFSEEEIASICEEIPVGRMGTPEEVAEMATLLAKAPTYLTGQIITMDGGWTTTG